MVCPSISCSLIEAGKTQARVTFYTQVAKRAKRSASRLPLKKTSLYHSTDAVNIT
jgi:hypothetical protein